MAQAAQAEQADESAEIKKKIPAVKWQVPNKRVLYALAPVVVTSIYLFGWRSLLLLIVVSVAAYLTEFVFVRSYYKEPVTSAVFVTAFLFTLSLPPTVPIWIALVGIVFGVAIGKMAFGGFGRNVFNPALTGRAFIYISFGAYMTSSWVEPFKSFPGGFINFLSDATTKATPLAGGAASHLPLFFGNVSGSLGETSAVLLLLGGIYIMVKKAANYRIVLSGVIGMLAFQTVLWAAGVRNALDPLAAATSGGFMLGILFMATDPVSAPGTNKARWIYGALIGVLTVLIRTFSIWKEGVMFAILLGNMFNPILDYYIKQRKTKEDGK
ncbi:MAG: RnfABCDGE type electron transport complex subunit D [Spirochaetes bacterium]|nr:RnfABCDGE type electron transport complex subunit D [Spirochaetota bacterium]